MSTTSNVPIVETPAQNPLGGPNPQSPGAAGSTASPPTLPAGSNLSKTSTLRAAIMPLTLLAIAGYFAIVSPEHVFLSPRNLSMLAIELSITAVLALGMLLVILPGHIDLSAGSGVGLIGGFAAVLTFEYGWASAPALAVSMVAAILLWWGMGAVIVGQRVPAFIITLGGLLVFRGAQWWIIHSSTIPVSRGGEHNLYSALTTYYLSPAVGLSIALVIIGLMVVGSIARWRRARQDGDVGYDGELAALWTIVSAQVILLFVLVCNAYRGVPLPAMVLGAVAVVVHAITRHTPYGRYLYAIGGNEEAAVVSGVPVTKVVIGAFAIMGGLTAITGFLQTAYAGASTTTVGSLMELDAVAACVIGGVSLRGGRGTVGGVLLGSLIMATLLNGMTLQAYSPEAKYIIRGLVLAAAVWIDVRLSAR